MALRYEADTGVDSKTKLAHSAVVTAANVHDSQVLDELLHRNETRMWGGSAYAGERAALKGAASRARDFAQHKASWHRALGAQERRCNRTNE